MKTKYIIPLIASIVFLVTSFQKFQDKPVLYIIGDSTVQNGSGKGADSLWGWGSFINLYFNTDTIEIQNHAKGGRSSRTFITEGRWDSVMKTLKKGDYVLIQFGHNDSGELADTLRARGTIKGIGDESKDIYNPIRKVNETVYTYGYYMRNMQMKRNLKGQFRSSFLRFREINLMRTRRSIRPVWSLGKRSGTTNRGLFYRFKYNGDRQI